MRDAWSFRDWLEGGGIGTIYIMLGSPREQVCIESIHDELRDESLNRELLGSLREAQEILVQCG